MLNAWASINKEFAAQKNNFGVVAIYFEQMPPGSGEYPSLAVNVLRQGLQPADHFGRKTPEISEGAYRFLMVLECEVRTKQDTWNQANAIAEKVRAYFDERRIPRKTWLKPDGTPNPSPQDSGIIIFGRARADTVQNDTDRQYKSIFLTWEVTWEKPVQEV
jgi:hypothetical protein